MANSPPAPPGGAAAPIKSYCQTAPGHPLHGPYHEQEYGFPVEEDDILFERLVLEINQAGLSWITILRKREGFRRAYDGFEIERVARYGNEERERLLADPAIIRNRLKVDAAIENARRILALREEHGSFKRWLEAHHPLDRTEWTKLFRRNFKFMGGEIVNEFLMSTGYLPGAHGEGCPVAVRALAASPPWSRFVQSDRPGGD
ncbi:MAG: DNA-3-methyladenine glycosylase I [Trueperaceae bacterium]